MAFWVVVPLVTAVGGSAALATVALFRRRRRRAGGEPEIPPDGDGGGGGRERLLGAAFESAGPFMLLLDGEGRLLAANRTALDLVAVPETELRGWPLWDTPWCAHSPTLRSELRAAVHAAAAGKVARCEAMFPARDGAPRYFDLALRPVGDAGPGDLGALLLAEAWDVTALRKAERDTAALAEKLRRAACLGSVGRLAGGVAHDFNNLLAAILGSVEVLRTGAPLDPPRREALAIIQQAAEAAAKLTVQLLAFGRPQAPAPWVIDPASALARVAPTLGEALGPGSAVSLEVKAPVDAWPIRIDEDQLQQILVNLVTNARDAMPAGGLLLVTLENLVVTAPRVFQNLEVGPGEYLQILVSNTGQSISDAVLERIFEPFFTTKEVGKGTGLGLSVVYGVVRQNGGYIEVGARPGGGTDVRVLFPRADSRALPRVEASARPSGGGEKILLVEDQQAIRAAARELLENLGYTVDAYADGESALAAAGSADGLDLLVSDLALPGCSGLELADRLRARWPDLEVLLVSGHGDEELASDENVPNTHLLTRPITAPSLAEKVRAILDGRSARHA